MDYWPRLRLTVHDDSAAFFEEVRKDGGGLWLFSSHGERSLWETRFSDGDWLAFGSETAGIAQNILDEYPGRVVRIPQTAGERCLNLSAAAAIALYEALRQTQSDTMRYSTR
jgi:tRNA (cytidine/uridine-2'-O-)-methyltransferase